MATPPELLPSGSGLGARLAAWAAQARADQAVADRARERFLQRTAGEDATFVGVLVELAERGTPVLVTTAAARRHRGVVRAVGSDFCALETPEGRDVLVHLDGVVAVRPEGRAAPAIGDRRVVVPVGLVEALALLGEERPRVLVVAGGDPQGLAGTLQRVGRDVLVLRLDGADRTEVYLRTANITEVTVA